MSFIGQIETKYKRIFMLFSKIKTGFVYKLTVFSQVLKVSRK